MASQWDPSGIELASQQLSSELGLQPGSELLQKFDQYIRNLNDFSNLAERRFKAQWTMLVRGLYWGRETEIWQYIADSGSTATVEPYVNTPLLQLLAMRFEATNQTKAANNVIELLDRLDKLTESFSALMDGVAANVAFADMRGAAAIINESRSSASERELVAIIFINRLVREGRLSDAIDLTKRIEDQLIQEEAWMVMSGQAVAAGKEEQYWQLMDRQDLTPTKWMSVARGMIPELRKSIDLGSEPLAAAE